MTTSNQTFQLTHNCNGSYPSKTVQIATYVVLMLCSFIGNMLIVGVFYRNKLLKTPVHYFIVNMAVADLIISVVVIPWGIVVEYYNSRWPLDGIIGTFICKLYFPAWGVSVAVSILTMVAIAVDRFHAVLFAMQPALITRKRCRLIITLIWIIALLFRVHYFYAVKLVQNSEGLFCKFEWNPDSYTQEALKIEWILFLIMSTVAALALTVLYSSTIGFLYQQQNDVQLASVTMKRRAKENRNVTCMLLSVVIIFYVVWTPHQIESLKHFLEPNEKVSCFFLWFGAYVLALLYPVLNPVVYYTFNEKYRQGFKEILCCRWIPRKNCCHQSKSSTSRQKKKTEESMPFQETCLTYNSA